MPKRNDISKVLIIGSIMSMLIANPAVGECVAVTGTPKFVPSSRRLQVKVLREGHPESGALVTVSGFEKAVPLSFSLSDADGKVFLKELPAGKYNVHAVDQDGKAASIDIEATAHGPEKTTSLDLLLGTARAWDRASSVQARRFKGIVVDPSGAGIPGATISVVNSRLPSRIIPLISGTDGSFSAALPEGEYVVFFGEQGFRSEVRRVIISPEGSDSLSVLMTVGSC